MTRRGLVLALIAAASFGWASAAVETTTIAGKVYTPGGTVATSGTITAVLSTSGTALDGGVVAKVAGWYSGTISAAGDVTGLLLVPNDAITPANTYYTVTFSAKGPNAADPNKTYSSSWTEKWAVTTTPDPVNVGNITRLDVGGILPPTGLTVKQAGAVKVQNTTAINIASGGTVAQVGSQADITIAAGGDSISVNGVAATDANLSDTTPAAAANGLNCLWQKDASPTTNISCYILQTAITKVGTITSGTWNGTPIANGQLVTTLPTHRLFGAGTSLYSSPDRQSVMLISEDASDGADADYFAGTPGFQRGIRLTPNLNRDLAGFDFNAGEYNIIIDGGFDSTDQAGSGVNTSNLRGHYVQIAGSAGGASIGTIAKVGGFDVNINASFPVGQIVTKLAGFEITTLNTVPAAAKSFGVLLSPGNGALNWAAFFNGKAQIAGASPLYFGGNVAAYGINSIQRGSTTTNITMTINGEASASFDWRQASFAPVSGSSAKSLGLTTTQGWAGLYLAETSATKTMQLRATGTGTPADSILSIDTGYASRTLTIPANATISGTNTGDTNAFTIFHATAGTDPVPDSAADTITFSKGSSPLIITGDSASDTIAFDLGIVDATRGGTDTNSSASTGVPRVTAGAWTYDAGFSHLAGTAAISQGGTGQTTATAAMDALDPLTTKGDVLAHDGADSVRVAVGVDGWPLISDAASTPGVKWQTTGQRYAVTALPSGASAPPTATNKCSAGILNVTDPLTVNTIRADISTADAGNNGSLCVTDIAGAVKIAANGISMAATGAVARLSASGHFTQTVLQPGTYLAYVCSKGTGKWRGVTATSSVLPWTGEVTVTNGSTCQAVTPVASAAGPVAPYVSVSNE